MTYTSCDGVLTSICFKTSRLLQSCTLFRLATRFKLLLEKLTASGFQQE